MLFLLFELDRDRYALDVADVVEVQAPTAAKAIPGAPAWVAGVIERHGEPVPVIDLAQLALGRPSQQWRSTRLVLVRYRDAREGRDAGMPSRLLGLIVEHATQTRRIERQRFADSGIATPHARWLGPVVSDELGMIQWVDVQHMLDDDVKALLFPPPETQTR
ncbi:Chemotaxis signal transduction protein [Paraburkholderia piptadeniae]|uniref:Chemotaxis signal transduction protein n=1 Tax=Paraburkholderia piptadeniae TaxID=1701573 RepID=A0A1N7RM92_9BURK|nr:chemotaxis protein CheW [Paraburkholderia piptadeniae]SIT35827.1 Chemotaxis signal transduction protein [Paraburkholderia piptadeniae]